MSGDEDDGAYEDHPAKGELVLLFTILAAMLIIMCGLAWSFGDVSTFERLKR